MRISVIEIQGPAGEVRVSATGDGAQVTRERSTRRAGLEQVMVAKVGRPDEHHAWLGAAVQAAAVLYGTTDGEPNADGDYIDDTSQDPPVALIEGRRGNLVLPDRRTVQRGRAH